MNQDAGSPPGPRSDDLTGVVLEGRYRIDRELGGGGMATVHLAEDLRVGRTVVIKVPRAAQAADPVFVTRFRREIRNLTRVEHPHVLKLIDAGEHAGLPYAVLHHLSGGSLKDRLAGEGRQTPLAVAAWLLDVSDALDHVHERGLVHRDVKPANVLFDDGGNAVVSDFGIARSMTGTDTGLTTTGGTAGSPGYLPPEAITGAEPDARYDQFSLAVTVYEALAARLPYDGSTPLELLGNLMHEEPAPILRFLPDLPPAAASALMQALQRSPAERHANCLAFAKAFQHGCGVSTTAIVATHRPRRTRWRALAAMGLAAASAAAGIAVWLASGPADEPDSDAGADIGTSDTEEVKPTGAPSVSTLIQPPDPPTNLGEPPWRLVTPPGAPPWTRVSEAQANEAGRLGVPVAFENSIGMRYVLVPAGEFMMGSPPDEPGRLPGERQHRVTINEAFYMQTTEVTNAQFRRFEPAHSSGSRAVLGGSLTLDHDDQPVIGVPPARARGFIDWLASRESRRVTLPSTEQWEYACRAGTDGRTCFDISDHTRHANLRDAKYRAVVSLTPDGSLPGDDGCAFNARVGSYLPNPWGIHDLFGNVPELCSVPGGRTLYRGPSYGDRLQRVRAAYSSAEPYTSAGGLRTVCSLSAAPSEPPGDELEEDEPEAAAHPPSDATAAAPPPTPRTDLGAPPWKLVTPPGAPSWASVSEGQARDAARLNVPVAFENAIGMRFVLIPAGAFTMGSPPDEPGRRSDETQLRVEVPAAFYMQTTEVTNAQIRWFAPSHSSGIRTTAKAWTLDDDAQPATRIAPDDAAAFTSWLSARDGRSYCLPTNEQWEYACRAGTTGATYFGLDDAHRHANIRDLSYSDSRGPGKYESLPVDDRFTVSASVASFLPNPWGLYDTIGNVGEICAATPDGRSLVRGASWANVLRDVRAARVRTWPAVQAYAREYGFRCVCSLPAEPPK